jgi:hypothetical protein
METFKPLSDFYEAIEDDVRINTTHISLYFALLQKWNLNKAQNPIIVFREELMKAAKISSRFTYNKYMNQLREFGYISYQPSCSQFTGSLVCLKRL